MSTPKISVVLAVHNGMPYLRSALKSILDQAFEDLEFIVVNDASSDESGKYLKGLKDHRIRIITNTKKIGLTKSLNKAIRKSRGEYIARMDADDISDKKRLQVQINFLEKNPKIAAVGSSAKLIDENNKISGVVNMPQSNQEIKRALPSYNPFIHASIVIRKEAIVEIGLYDESFLFAQDYDLMLRLASRFKVENIKKPLIFLRRHSKTTSWSKMDKQLKFALQARIKAVKNGDLKLWQTVYLVKPIISSFFPVTLKKPIITFFNR